MLVDLFESKSVKLNRTNMAVYSNEYGYILYLTVHYKKSFLVPLSRFTILPSHYWFHILICLGVFKILMKNIFTNYKYTYIGLQSSIYVF